MKKSLRLAAITLVVFAAAAVAALFVAAWMGDRKMRRTVDIRVVPVAYTKDRAALKLGKYLFESRGCAECHGDDGRGIAFIDTPDMHVRSPNITSGPGGVVSGYNEGDWVRSIRHGVNPKGHALLIMPSEDYNRMSDPDFAALVAFIRSLPPVKGEAATIRAPLTMRALYGIGAIKDSSEKIDHRRAPAQSVTVAATPEHGAYVAAMCAGCHGASFAGGKIAGKPPDWPAASNLTPGEGSVMARYDTVEKFVAMIRTGQRPDGSAVNKVMPFMSLRNLNDTDLHAIYLYLRALPPRATGEGR